MGASNRGLKVKARIRHLKQPVTAQKEGAEGTEGAKGEAVVG